MGIFDGIIGAVTQGAFGLIGGAMQQNFQAQQAQQAQGFSAEQVRQQEDFQAEQAQISRDYNTQMTSTAYQRATADMKAAGLNPMLAYQQGGASSIPSPTPTGSAASGQQASGVNRFAAFANTASTIGQLELLNAQTEKAKADADMTRSLIPGAPEKQKEEINLIKQQAVKTVQDSYLSATQKAKLEEETKNAIDQGRNIRLEALNIEQTTEVKRVVNELNKLEIPKAVNEARAQSSWWMRNVAPYMPDILKSTTSAAGAAKVFK